MSDTDNLTAPQRFVIQKMREGAALRSRPSAGVSPWLEIPGTTRVVHVSFRTMAGLYDRELIARAPDDPGAPAPSKWALTPAGMEVVL